MPSPKRARKTSNCWNKHCPITCVEVDESTAVAVGNELVSATGLMFFITRSPAQETIPFSNTTSIVAKTCLQRALAKIPIQCEPIPASAPAMVPSAEVFEPLQVFWLRVMADLASELQEALRLDFDDGLPQYESVILYIFQGVRFFSVRNRLEGRDQIKALHTVSGLVAC